MKLTKAIREQFVDDVLAGIPVKHHFNINDAKSEIVKAIHAQLPSDLAQFVETYPDMVYRRKYLKLYDLEYLTEAGHKAIPSIYTVDHESCKLVDITKWVISKRLVDAEQEERKALRSRLLEISASCSTLAKLKVALPELESYMPVEEVKPNLPVASGTVITDLLQLGLKIPK